MDLPPGTTADWDGVIAEMACSSTLKVNQSDVAPSLAVSVAMEVPTAPLGRCMGGTVGDPNDSWPLL